MRTVYLATPDMKVFYEKLGFKNVNSACYCMIKVRSENDDRYVLPK